MKIERMPVEIKPRSVPRTALPRLVAAAGVMLAGVALIAGAGYAAVFASTSPSPRDNAMPAMIAVTGSPALLADPAALSPEPSPTAQPSPTGPAPITATSGGARGEIHSVYADAQRITIDFSLYNLPDEVIHPPDGRLFMFMGSLEYPDGAMFNAASGGQMDAPVVPGALTSTYYFDHLEPPPADGAYDLVFIMGISEYQPQSADESTGGDASWTEDRLYEFRFVLNDVPVTGGLSLEVGQTRTANGIDMTLQAVSITPALARLTLCFDVPPGSYDWSPIADLTIDGTPGQLSGWGDLAGTEITGTESERCLRMDYSLPGVSDPHRLTFAVNRLQTSVPEVMSDAQLARAHERLAAQGIAVEFVYVDHGSQHRVISKPANMSDEQVWQAIYNAQTDQHAGPWVFVVDVP